MKKVLVLIFSILFFVPQLASADGGLFFPPDYYVFESTQKAVIWYENNSESLYLSFEFQGDAKDFGWIIPTPTKPEVSKSTNELFTSLEELTQSDNLIIPMSKTTNESLGTTSSGVAVLETKEAGIYKISILKATEGDSLFEWLKENNYSYPEAGKYILDEYIKNKWYFTACQVNSEVASPLIDDQLRQGYATPLKLKFYSPNIIFPLKISSVMGYNQKPASYQTKEQKTLGQSQEISNSSDVNIELYVFSKNKKEMPGFDTVYANWIKPTKVKKLAYEEEVSWQNPEKKVYLTKLTRQMSLSQMTDDLIIRDADNNKAVKPNANNFNWSLFFQGLLLSLLGLLLFWFSPFGLVMIGSIVAGFLIKKHLARVVFWVIQGLLFLLQLCLFSWFVYLFLLDKYQLNNNLEFWIPILVVFSISIIAEIIVGIFEYRQQKKNPS